MATLGLEAAEADVNTLFDSWDPDGSGTLELAEVQKQLRPRAALTPKLRPGGAGEIARGCCSTSAADAASTSGAAHAHGHEHGHGPRPAAPHGHHEHGHVRHLNLSASFGN